MVKRNLYFKIVFVIALIIVVWFLYNQTENKLDLNDIDSNKTTDNGEISKTSYENNIL